MTALGEFESSSSGFPRIWVFSNFQANYFHNNNSSSPRSVGNRRFPGPVLGRFSGPILGHLWAPFGCPKWAQMGPKTDPQTWGQGLEKARKPKGFGAFLALRGVHFWVHFGPKPGSLGPDLARICPPSSFIATWPPVSF